MPTASNFDGRLAEHFMRLSPAEQRVARFFQGKPGGGADRVRSRACDQNRDQRCDDRADGAGARLCRPRRSAALARGRIAQSAVVGRALDAHLERDWRQRRLGHGHDAGDSPAVARQSPQVDHRRAIRSGRRDPGRGPAHGGLRTGTIERDRQLSGHATGAVRLQRLQPDEYRPAVRRRSGQAPRRRHGHHVRLWAGLCRTCGAGGYGRAAGGFDRFLSRIRWKHPCRPRSAWPCPSIEGDPTCSACTPPRSASSRRSWSG